MPFGGGAVKTILLSCGVLASGIGWLSGTVGAAVSSANELEIGTPALAYDGDFPDPSLLFVNGTYYAYSTNTEGENLPVMSSRDLVHWRRIGDAMAFLPTWAAGWSGFTWAPSVAAAPSGGYEAFFSTLDTSGQECIGRATAPTPTGPFLDTSSSPLVCSGTSGAIDPSLFHAAEGDYLLWKADTGKGKPAEIWAQRLSASDSTLRGAAVLLLSANESWEDGIVEGPALADVDGTLYLLFSANRWDTSDYAIAMTSCDSPLGPCSGSGVQIVVASRPGMAGAGGPDVFSVGGHQYLAFSAWTGGEPGSNGSRRSLFVSSLGTTASTLAKANESSFEPATPIKH